MAIQKVVGIVAIAVALTVALVTVATAAPPVPSSISTAGITVTTDVECHGTVTDSVTYDSTWSTKDVNNSLEDEERIGQIQYDSYLKAVDGYIQYSSDFAPDGSNSPNLAVERRIGYVADNSSMIAWLDYTENVGMTIVSEGDDNGINSIGGLCPFQQGQCIPPSCTVVAAGSQLSKVTLVSASTKTKVTATESPRLHYEIDARGNDAGYWADEAHTDGPYGVGTVSAGMKVSANEGQTCTSSGTLGPYPRAGALSYSDMTTASGIWEFSKSMTYQSQIPSVGIPGSWPVFQ